MLGNVSELDFTPRCYAQRCNIFREKNKTSKDISASHCVTMFFFFRGCLNCTKCFLTSTHIDMNMLYYPHFMQIFPRQMSRHIKLLEEFTACILAKITVLEFNSNLLKK